MNELAIKNQTAQQELLSALADVFNGKQYRYWKKDDELWFVAKDIVEAAGGTWHAPTFTKCVGEGGGVTNTPLEINGISQNVLACTAKIAVKWLTLSRLPASEALADKVWEVMDRVMKGEKVNQPKIPQTFAEALRLAADAAEAAEKAEKARIEAERLEAIAVAERKQVAAEKEIVVAEKEVVEKKLNSLGTAVRSLYTAPTGTSTVRDCAKFFSSRGWNISESTLRKTLQEKGWLTKGKGPTATASAISTGYMAAGEVVTNHLTGWSGEVKTPKITGKGFTKITVSLKDWGYSQMADDDCTLALGF